jgi:hypothetical protein
MALSEIFDGVRDSFDALLPGINWRDGGEHLGAQDAPPRVVWVPTEDTYVASEFHYDDSTFPPTADNPRPLLLCNATVQVHLWGASRDDAEHMRDVFVAALRAAAGAAFKVLGGFWPVQDAQFIVQAGRVYVLTISFLVPILDAKPGSATLTATVQDVDTSSVP